MQVPTDSAVLMVLGDQPAVEPVVINALLEIYRSRNEAIVQPVYQEGRGHPVLFAPALRSELENVTGDQGARKVLALHPGRIHEVFLPRPRPHDLDTPADLERLSESWNANAY